jgi:UTP--glucose-1-phosphate uridylyltransferase
MPTRRVRRAIIPATGISTNLLPATKVVPQELLPLVDRPLIQYAVEEALEAGIEEVVIVTGRSKNTIADHFDRAPELEDVLDRDGAHAAREVVVRSALRPGGVTYIRQQQPLGLGHALWCARQAVGDGPFAVLLPNDVFQARPPCLVQLLAAYQQVGGNVAAVVPLARDRAARHGAIAAIDRGERLIAVARLAAQWTPADPTLKWAAVGRFVIESTFLERLRPTAASGAIPLVEALAAAATDGALSGYAFAGKHFDCSDTLGLFEAALAFTLARPEFAAAARHLLARHVERWETPAPARETSGLVVSA